jgi:hypothetical protein
VDADGKKIITYSDGSTLQGDIVKAVTNADGSKTITMDGTNSTLTGSIVSAINEADGSVTIGMADGSKVSLPAEVMTILSNNEEGFDVDAYLANPEYL